MSEEFAKAWDKNKPCEGVEKPFVDIAFTYAVLFWSFGRTSVRFEDAAERDRLKEEKAGLLEALEAYVGKFGNCGDTYDSACAAIAKVKGEKQ